MRIIYYSPHPTHDIVSEVGYSTHQRETIAAMRELGHNVLPVILGGTEKNSVNHYHEQLLKQSWWKRLVLKLTPLIIINTLKDLLLIKHDKHAVAVLYQSIINFKPELVYERSEYLQNKGTVLCRKLGIKHFLEVNAPSVEEMRSFEGPSLLHFLGHRKEKQKLRSTNQIFTVSTALKNYLHSKYRLNSDIFVVPNCINPDLANTNAQNVNAIRNQYDLNKKTVIGFVGSIFPHHGIESLISAFGKVSLNNPELLLMIVGDGAQMQYLQDFARKSLVEGTYLFVGKVPHKDVFNYIELFNLAVMPKSNWYGSPMKVLEYGIMEVPVIAPNNGPLNDIMIHNQTGYLIEQNVESLEMAFANFLKNPKEFQTMAANFKEVILKNYTWKMQTEQILGFALN